MSRLDDLNTLIPQKRAELQHIFDTNTGANGAPALNNTQLEDVNRRNAELGPLVIERNNLQAIADEEKEIEARKSGKLTRPRFSRSTDERASNEEVETRSLGEMIVGSRAYETRNSSKEEVEIPIELRALFQTSAGIKPETTRNRPILLSVQPSLSILDLIRQTTTSQIAVTYLEETVLVNGAGGIAEGGDYGESELKLEDKSSLVKKVGTYLPMTDEQLEDVDYAESYINERLPFLVKARLQKMALLGNGVGANLLGLYNVPGIITTDIGAGTLMDAIFAAMTEIQVQAEAQADAFAIHPRDWMKIRLAKTDDGQYIWGHPSTVGPLQLFGLSPISTSDVPEGRTLVGAYNQHCEHAYKRGIETQVGVIDKYFTQGKKAVRADVRVAQVVNRPKAFSEVKKVV